MPCEKLWTGSWRLSASLNSSSICSASLEVGAAVAIQPADKVEELAGGQEIVEEGAVWDVAKRSGAHRASAR